MLLVEQVKNRTVVYLLVCRERGAGDGDSIDTTLDSEMRTTDFDVSSVERLHVRVITHSLRVIQYPFALDEPWRVRSAIGAGGLCFAVDPERADFHLSFEVQVERGAFGDLDFGFVT